MRKCPRCGYEINEDEKFCPHCGLDLQQHKPKGPKNKSMTYLLYVIIFFSFITIPLLYSRLLQSYGNDIVAKDTEKVELKDVMDTAPTSILSVYTTLADYNKQFSNVSDYIKGIETYEKELSAKGDYVFDKSYQILVLDNYNIYYTLEYSVTVNDLTIKIQREFDRAHTYNTETVTVRKNNAQGFKDLIFTKANLEQAYTFIDDQELMNQLMKEFSAREDEFELKKEKLGHYGLGNYKDKSSFVAHRTGETYYSEMIYCHEASEYID